MSRPKIHDDRVSTQVRFAPDLHRRLAAAADERDVSVNWLIVRACEELLAHLIPVDEIRLTRRGSEAGLSDGSDS